MPDMRMIRERSETVEQRERRSRAKESDLGGGGLYRYLVLGLLRNGSPRHGYALMKEYERRSGAQIGSGRFYCKLQRLAAEGLVATAPNPPGADRRRTPYRITAAGAASFDAWQRDSTTPDTTREDELCARAMLLAAADPEVVFATLDRWRSDIWMRGSGIEEEHGRAVATVRRNSAPSFDPLPLLLARRLKHAAADVEFIDEFRRGYEQWRQRAAATHIESRASRPRMRRDTTAPSSSSFQT